MFLIKSKSRDIPWDSGITRLLEVHALWLWWCVQVTRSQTSVASLSYPELETVEAEVIPWPRVYSGMPMRVCRLSSAVSMHLQSLQRMPLMPHSKHRSLSNKKQNCHSNYNCNYSPVIRGANFVWEECVTIHFGSKVFPPPFTSILSQIHNSWKKSRIVWETSKKSCLQWTFQIFWVWAGKVSILSILTKPVVPILTSLNLESVTTLSLTPRPASDPEGSA